MTSPARTDRHLQLRGLIIHFRAQWVSIRLTRFFKRGLIPTFPPSTSSQGGTCLWCRTPTATPRTRWHPSCVNAYHAATGRSLRYMWNKKGPPPCPCGNGPNELDHHDALILAWTSADFRRLIRAYSLDNLVWLCRKCHREKTVNDLNLLTLMRATQTCLMGLVPTTTDPDMGVHHWALAEGGLATGLIKQKDGTRTALSKFTMRRTPVTYRPESTTCPRCLAALERHTPKPQDIQLSKDWYLHEAKAVIEARESLYHQPPLF